MWQGIWHERQRLHFCVTAKDFHADNFSVQRKIILNEKMSILVKGERSKGGNTETLMGQIDNQRVEKGTHRQWQWCCLLPVQNKKIIRLVTPSSHLYDKLKRRHHLLFLSWWKLRDGHWYFDFIRTWLLIFWFCQEMGIDILYSAKEL